VAATPARSLTVIGRRGDVRKPSCARETVLAVPQVRVEARWIFNPCVASIEIRVTGVTGTAAYRAESRA